MLPLDVVELVAAALDELPPALVDCAPLLCASSVQSYRLALGRVSRLWRDACPLRTIALEDGPRVDRFLDAPGGAIGSVRRLMLGSAVDLDPAPIDRHGYLQRVLDRLPGLETVVGVEMDRLEGAALVWPAGVRSVVADRATVIGLAQLPPAVTALRIDHLVSAMSIPFTGHSLLAVAGRHVVSLTIKFRDHPLTDTTALRSLVARATSLMEVVLLDALPVEVTSTSDNLDGTDRAVLYVPASAEGIDLTTRWLPSLRTVRLERVKSQVRRSDSTPTDRRSSTATSCTSCRRGSSALRSPTTAALPSWTRLSASVRDPRSIATDGAGAESLANPALLTHLRQLEFGFPLWSAEAPSGELNKSCSDRSLSLRVFKV